MQIRNLASGIACLILCATILLPATAQISTKLRPLAEVTVRSRVIAAADDARRLTLHGNTHPMAQSKYETGRVAPGLAMERIMLLLQRSPEQESALAAFNERQYDPRSPDFHHWLHAEEFGRLYGPSDADLAAVTGWLQNHGFQIDDVNKGRTVIQFSGTASQVEDAFQLEMHRYLVNGESHIANDRDPSIPEALAPVVAGLASLHDFFGKPQHVVGKRVWIDRATGKKTVLDPQAAAPAKTAVASEQKIVPPAASGARPAPQFTSTLGGDTIEDLTPYDFAAIYNILPLWNARTPTNGKGVNIAISGVSDILQADVTNFRKTFGLPAMTLKTIHNGADPGADKGPGQLENSLDVEMTGATAPGAQVILVVSGNTSTTAGFLLSDQYIIDKETAPIMSASYGECELDLGTAGNKTFNTIWQQGATEGISIFESSGDQGSAGCSSSDTAGPNPDTYGLEVNGMASSPYVTAVGGTDFTWSFVANGIPDHWNASNGSYLQTAKGIMPEVPWNSTCTNPLLLPLFSASSAEDLCNGLITYDNGSFNGLIKVTGGSGGPSHCTEPTGAKPGTCAGGYAKPSWQAGFGSSSSHRDVPDVSLFASGGFPSSVNGSAILLCESVQTGSCDYKSSNGLEVQEVGGTSASSPLWAGIMALIVQQTNSSQGLANPVLYGLYAKQVAAKTDCDSSTVADGNTCVFYDVTAGTNAQVCITGDTNCTTTTSGDQLGILSGYSSATGYDDGTGLGTVNVTNLVSSWVAATGGAGVTLAPASLTFAADAGTPSAAQAVTVQNTGSSAVTLTSETLTGSNASSYTISANTCGASLAAGANCTVSIEFQPAAAGSLTASLSVADSVAGSPQTVSLIGAGYPAGAAAAATLSATSLSFGSSPIGAPVVTQQVTVTDSGNFPLAISSIAVGGTNPKSFTQTNTCATPLAPGANCVITVTFNPAAFGSLSASIAVTDNATGSPQSIAVSGSGTEVGSYTLSGAAVTLAAGSNGTSSITATGTGGYTGTITLSACTVTASPTGAINPPACTVGSAITIAAGSTAASSSVTITSTSTTASLGAPEGKSKPWQSAGEIVFGGLLLFGISARRRSWKALLCLLVLFTAFGLVTGCGGGGSGSSGGGGGKSGTTAGAYTLSVTGTDADGLKQTATIALTVN